MADQQVSVNASGGYCHFKQPEDLNTFLQSVVSMCIKFMHENTDRNTPVVQFRSPADLKSLFNINLPSQGAGIPGVLADLEKIFKYSVRTGHPRFFNQLWAGIDIIATVGEWLTAVMNSSTYTYEVAPVFSLMEIELVDQCLSLLGWQNGDGVLTPGGAMANLMSMMAARQATLPNCREEGNTGPRLMAYCSKHAHYTMKRSAMIMGLGFNNVVYVDIDPRTGKMLPSALEAAIQKDIAAGHKPFYVCATASTTVMGAFDPLREVSEISRRYGMWMHIDAAWGGSVLMSESRKALMDGAELADSVAWCAHKMLGMPQQCAIILCKAPNVLKNCNASNADYLFHIEHDERPYDLGDKTLLCGRRQDSLKFWLSWKCHGKEGFGARVDRAFGNRDYFVSQMRQKSDRYEILWEPEGINVCFWYIPASLRGQAFSVERNKKLGEATFFIRTQMQRDGNMLVNYQPLDDYPNFWRIIITNPDTTHADLDFVLQEIDRIGSTWSG